MARLCFALALFCLTCAPPAGAQLPQPPGSSGPRLSARASVSLLTILPGTGPADAFGHSALRVRDPALRLDRTYNYGTYDFRDPYFIPKFTYGRLTYVLSTAPFRPFLRRYRSLDRPVIEQRLNLSRAQAQRLFRFLEWNAQPSNRAYRYDFLFDNCSTRPRDALRDALGDTLRFDRAALPQRTFRHHLDRFVIDKPLLDFGFDLGLGLPTDRTATASETMFLPEYLMDAFAGATISSGAGSGASRQPLVARTDTLFWVEGAQFPARAAFPWPALVTWLLFAALLGLTAWRWRRVPLTWPDVLLFGTVGAMGVVIWFLAFLSEHVVTRHNLNAIWALPTHLALAGGLLWTRGNRRGGGRFVRGYVLASGAAALVLALGWPFWPQDLHAAALPLVLMLVLRSARRARLPQATPAPAHKRTRAEAG